MKCSCRRVVAGLAFALVLQGMECTWAQGPAAGRGLQLAPLNPEFQQHIREVRAGQRPVRTASGRALGFVPGPVDLSHLTVKDAARNARDPALPASYDLRTQGKVTPVGNQGEYGTCWSFATYGSMESCLLPGVTANFSENNLVNLAGFDWGFDDGGQGLMASAYLARWSGPIADSDDPYYNIGGSPANKAARRHVQQIRLVSNRDYAGIKRAVMDYGAVYTSVQWEDPYFNQANNAYYYNVSTNRGNHAVTVVGWDDNYDRTRFNTPAPRNGAWIIKNSWGPEWGEKGFFYCSYDDTRVGFNNFVFMNAEPPDNYARIYQHDPLGWIDNVGAGPVAWGANMFVSLDGAPSAVKAVSFYAAMTNMGYQVFIYTGVSADAPRSGTLRATASGTLAMAGYHTVPLPSPAPLAPNERFSVVVQFTTPGFDYPLPAEYALPGYSSKATAAPGQSFFSMDGTTWADLLVALGNQTANLCIKAFTSPSASTVPQSAKVVAGPATAPRTDEPAAVETAAGQQFKLVTPAGAAADLFLGFSPSLEEADLRLMYSANQRSFATMFEGKWIAIGTGAAPKTFGKSLVLEQGVSGQDGVVWTFSHKLKSGQSCGIYQKRGDQWVNTHTVTCK